MYLFFIPIFLEIMDSGGHFYKIGTDWNEKQVIYFTRPKGK